MNRNYAGQNIDDFFVQHGGPTRHHPLHSGDRLYTWNSGVSSFYLPQTTTFKGSSTPYGFSGTAQTFDSGPIDVFCEVQLVAAPDGTIKSITILNDTFGLWSLFRCAEFFKEGKGS
jgi:hypothetical protein